jgi:curved DNA-binding protein CbpA
MRGLPLAPVDGFILSRIDGSVTDEQIATLTGLDSNSVRASLDKLVTLGVVTFGDLPPQAKPEPRPSKMPDLPVTEDSDVGRIPRGLYDPAELDEAVDISVEQRRQVLDRYYVLSEITFYQLLGIDRHADKKTIKRRYLEAAAHFHPDRYFRKQLGSFKAKMEAIFARLTLANDTLLDEGARAEYDGYLLSLESTRKLEAQLEQQNAEAAIPREEPKTPPPQPSPVASSAPPPQGRRDALAMRLRDFRRTQPPGQTAIPSAPPSDPDALRRYHDDRLTAARDKMAREHVMTALAAAGRGDWVAASTAYRLALTVNPNDPDIKRAQQDAQEKANGILGEQYKKQASYEERNADWPAAARSWTRAARCLEKDPQCQDRAALCILRAEGSLHEARTFALKAVELDPKKSTYRVTLAEIYMAAGLVLNARRELETAVQLAPDDASLQTLLKKVAKAK